MNGLQPLFLTLAEWPLESAAIIAATALLYYVMFKRIVISAFDPLAYGLFFSSLATSAFLIVAFGGYLDFFGILHFVLSQVAFMGAILLAAPSISSIRRRGYSTPQKVNISAVALTFYLLCLVVFVISQLAQYAQFGLPVLMASRLEIDAGEGGTNIFTRFISPTSSVVLILSPLLVFTQVGGTRIAGIIGAVFLLFTLLVSGSKSGAMGLLISLSIVAFYLEINGYRISRRAKKWFLIFGAIVAASALIMVRYKYSDDLYSAFQYMAYRAMITGDGLVMGYVGMVVAKFPDYNWFVALFKGPLMNLHLIDSFEEPPSIGFELFRYYNPWSSDLLGPNSRHNLIGLRYFDYEWSFAFSAALGCVVGSIRRLLCLFGSIQPLGFCFASLLILSSSFAEADFYLFTGAVTKMIMLLPILYIASWIMVVASRRSFRAQA